MPAIRLCVEAINPERVVCAGCAGEPHRPLERYERPHFASTGSLDAQGWRRERRSVRPPDVRVLVVSDIHANWQALRRIPDRFDHVLCLGDLVDYGPDPVPCLQWVRDRDAFCVRGNHDEAVARSVSCRCGQPMREASERTREVMRDELDAQQLATLGSRPLRAHVELGGVRFELVHATPSDPLYRYLRPSEPERWAEEVERIDADVILVGHTHLPMTLHFGDKVVVNPGSVGQPRDGDPRAAYAIVEDGEPRLQRCEYDVEASVAALAGRRLPKSVFAQLAGLLRKGRA